MWFFYMYILILLDSLNILIARDLIMMIMCSSLLISVGLHVELQACGRGMDG